MSIQMSDDEIEASLRAVSVEARNQAIINAHESGFSLRRIARLVGMTHRGVSLIIQRNQP